MMTMATGAGKTLAIIRSVRCGVGDRDTACLRFEIRISEGSMTTWSLSWDEAKPVIEAYGVSDVHDLDGKPCWADTSERGLIRWIGPAKL
jgi:hypothetical protein